MVKAGKGSEGVERARALAAAAPDDPDRLFTLGLAQSDVDIDGAMASFRRVVELAPRHVLARYNLALVLRRADRLPEAIDQLRRALEVEARPEIHYSLGIIYLHQGDLDRAESALRAAVAVQGDHADAHVTLGAVLEARHDWAGAARSLRAAMALRPGVSDGPLHAREGPSSSRAMRAGRAPRSRKPNGSGSRGARAGSDRVDGGGCRQARVRAIRRAPSRLFQRATTVLDDYAPAHYQLGLAFERLGRSDAARAAFARAAQLNPASSLPPAGISTESLAA